MRKEATMVELTEVRSAIVVNVMSSIRTINVISLLRRGTRSMMSGRYCQ